MLTGDEALKSNALQASELGFEVELMWGTPAVRANLTPDSNGNYDYVGIAAALVSTNPGRALLTEIPAEVTEYLAQWDSPIQLGEGEIVIY